MVMKHLKNRAEKDKQKSKSEFPDWISSKNSSLKAWEYVEQLKIQKILYINRHHKSTDYLTQKCYQIKGSEIAQALKISRSSLMNTSKYSKQFKIYLDDVNSELMNLKNVRLERSKNTCSRGSIRNSKEQLLNANTELRNRIDKLETQNTEELVRFAFDQLPLPVKRKIGID